MNGDKKSVNLINNVVKFSKTKKNKKFKIIYCPPYTLLNLFSNKLKNTKIDLGAQNCHQKEDYGSYTGFISSKMLKNIGAKYIIIGHSENRINGETDFLINQKIKASLKNNLKIIFCIGETLIQRKKNRTNKILSKQIEKGIKGVNKKRNLLIAYEPFWSIGTGLVPKTKDLEKNINFIKDTLKNKYKLKNSKVIYGGSVNPKNVIDLKKIKTLDGFLVGNASLNAKKFIDIIKKTYN